MDSASDAALRCGAELIVHAYPDGARARPPAAARARPRPHRRPRRRDQPGRRDAAGLREGGGADRQRRRPLQPDRVPRQEPRRDVVHLPHPPADRRGAGRREGRQPALQPGPRLRAGRALHARLRGAAGDRGRQVAGARPRWSGWSGSSSRSGWASSSGGLQLPLPRGLPRGGLPRARDRHPDRRRPRRRPRPQHPQEPRGQPHGGPAERALPRR